MVTKKTRANILYQEGWIFWNEVFNLDYGEVRISFKNRAWRDLVEIVGLKS